MLASSRPHESERSRGEVAGAADRNGEQRERLADTSPAAPTGGPAPAGIRSRGGPRESGEVPIGTFSLVEQLIELAADLCGKGELAAAAETYRQAAAAEARTGDMDRALVCLRMASSLRAELLRAERASDA